MTWSGVTELARRPIPQDRITEHRLRGFDRTVIRWSELGAGDPVVVSSPLGVPLWYWTPLFERLATRFRVVFVHRRGLWGSATPTNLANLSVDAHARDIATVVEAAGCHRFSLLAYCSGAAPALRSLAHLAVKPRRLVVISARLQLGEAVDGRVIFQQARMNPYFLKVVAESIASHAPIELRSALLDELADPSNLQTFLTSLELGRAYDFSDVSLSGIDTIVCHAENERDGIAESTREFASKSSGAAKIVELAGADHFAVRCRPEAVEAMLIEFLRDRAV